MGKAYEVEQILNIGYYGGFHHRTLIKTQAKITDVSDNGMIQIKVKLSHGGYRTMFGYHSQLREMEENYNK